MCIHFEVKKFKQLEILCYQTLSRNNLIDWIIGLQMNKLLALQSFSNTVPDDGTKSKKY